jgi:hypothetical protein
MKALALVFLLLPATVLPCDHCRHHRHHPARAAVALKRDTCFVTIHDTVLVHLPCIDTPQVSYNFVNYDQRQYVAAAPLTTTLDSSARPAGITFQPFVAVGLRALPHAPPSWNAGIGVSIIKGHIGIDCGALLEPSVLANTAQATSASDGTPLLQPSVAGAGRLSTVIYGSLKYIF